MRLKRFCYRILIVNADNYNAKRGKTRVAIIGTQGVPAQYGGFETLVENMIGENASPEVEYTVLCSN